MGVVVAHAVVETEGDALLVRWELAGDGPAAVDIGVGLTPDTVDHAHVFTVEGGEQSARLEGVGRRRHYVSVSPHGGGGAAIVADRRVPFEGVTNFRDLGGYPTAAGGLTRWGRVFRSDALHRLTEGDLLQYESLGMRAVFDLRRDEERALHPNPFPSLQFALLSGAPTLAEFPAEAAAGEQLLRDMYVSILATAATSLGRLMEGLAVPGGLPAVIHCAGGKDRTGIAAALLLELLGVGREHVLDDYELTARYRLREHQQESYANLLAAGMPPEAAAGVLGAPRWAMAEALEALDRDYGGVEAYVTGPARVAPATVDQLRALLVD